MADQKICKVCGNKAKFVYSRGNGSEELRILEVFLCRRCGLLFVGNPIPDGELNQAYERMDSPKHYAEIAETTYLKASNALDDLNAFLSKGTEDISLLDVGCGYGHLLDSVAKTYPAVKIFGHELPGDCASACQEKGFHIFTCSLEDIHHKFSIVTLLDVAEHVPRPGHVFSACRGMLKDGGIIYLHTPRRCIWDTLFLRLVRIPGLNRLAKVWLDPRISIYHLQLWTDRALRLALENAGFELLYLRSTTELSWPLERYTNIFLGEKCHLPKSLLWLATRLIDILFVRLGTLRNKAICLARKSN
ncbi:MAG TPA: class I SAM-dependent methyltransferase [bacterium]|jgi:SAM-dependent methyltransferase